MEPRTSQAWVGDRLNIGVLIPQRVHLSRCTKVPGNPQALWDSNRVQSWFGVHGTAASSFHPSHKPRSFLLHPVKAGRPGELGLWE